MFYSTQETSCVHNLDCTCSWFPGRKVNGFSELEVLMNTEWVDCDKFEIVKRKFLISPIGVIPQTGYSGDRCKLVPFTIFGTRF